jgi:hypothetical protein
MAIPGAVMKAVEFDLDEIVDVREEEGRIIIEPYGKKPTIFMRS